jgi:DNA-binding NarL/FixJ family response regulator
MASTKQQILVVDDSDIIRGAIRRLLQENEQYAVHDAGDAEGAMQKAREIKPNVILLDLSLPGASGMTLAPRFRAESPDSTVVLTSAQDRTILEKLTQPAGLQWCIEKSELSSELVPMLEKIAAS